jgi:hypothetical protein
MTRRVRESSSLPLGDQTGCTRGLLLLLCHSSRVTLRFAAGEGHEMSQMLLHLRPENALVQEKMLALLGAGGAERPSVMDQRLGDFDGGYWRIELVESAPTQIFVCLEVPCYAQLKALVESADPTRAAPIMNAMRWCLNSAPSPTPHTLAFPPLTLPLAALAWRPT